MRLIQRLVAPMIFLLVLVLSLSSTGTAHAQQVPLGPGDPHPATSPPTTIATNPNLVGGCGIKIIVVLDESSSINQSGAIDQVRQAARAFVGALVDTGSQAAVIEFGTRATQVFTYTTVTQALVNGPFEEYINGGTAPSYSPPPIGLNTQYTNWDDALEKVQALNSTGGLAPLVVFVTDGAPTAYNRAFGDNTNPVFGTTGNTPTYAFYTAQYEANTVKTQGSHILAVGVGAASGSQTELVGISGPDVYDGTPPPALDIKTTDVVLVTNFSDLEAQLRQVALELCANSVTITKYTDSGGPNGNLQPAPGWTFYGKVGSPPPGGVAYTWVAPTGTAGSEVSAITTLPTGAATFQWKPTDVNAQSLVTITEQSQANFEFVAIRCQQKTSVGGVQTTRTFTPTTSISDARGPSWSFPISPTVNFPILTCSVVNDDLTLVQLKSFTGQLSGADVTLAWETDFELDNAGFNIYRATSEGGDKVKLNGLLIGAEGNGVTYQYVDTDVGDGTYYYWLEDVDTAGLATMHGPVAIAAGDAAADLIDRLWLPIIVGGN